MRLLIRKLLHLENAAKSEAPPDVVAVSWSPREFSLGRELFPGESLAIDMWRFEHFHYAAIPASFGVDRVPEIAWQDWVTVERATLDPADLGVVYACATEQELAVLTTACPVGRVVSHQREGRLVTWLPDESDGRTGPVIAAAAVARVLPPG